MSAFQPSAFQPSAWQVTITVGPAFQNDAFQSNGFQSGATINPAFQENAFQWNGYQTGGSPLPPTPPVATTTKGAGRKRRRRQYVEVDGQTFYVESAEQARELLQRARSLAERAAERDVQKTLATPSQKAAAPRSPAIRTNVPEAQALAAEVNRAIRKVYADARLHAEIALLMEQAALADDEETITLLLM